MILQQETKPTVELQSLAEELQSYILSFLSYQDILRCTSVCKSLRQTYISCSELQYIVELGGQRLLPVPNTFHDSRTSISKRLQLLRDNAHAWFKFDIHSFETVSIPVDNNMWVVNGHLGMWERHGDSTTIFPIIPKPSQYTIERDWSPMSLRSDPNAYGFDVLMDPAQNLIAVVYATVDDHSHWDDERIYIDLGTLDGGGIHPQAVGRTLFRSELPGTQNGNRTSINLGQLKLKCFGRHIALWHSRQITSEYLDERIWGLQIWDWQHSTTSSSVLSATINIVREETIDFCFLGNDRLLVFNDDMKLYLIEDMSQAPQLLACFLLPGSLMRPRKCIYSTDDIAHSSRLQILAQQTMWTSDPEHQLLSVVTSPPSLIFIISTRIFFHLDLFEGMPGAIPWKNWGPLNARVFQSPSRRNISVGGNRVLLAFPADDTVSVWSPKKYRLRVMDFSPLAVERRQGLGRVVKEPSTIEITTLQTRESLTTSLPYVEVVLDHDRIFGYRGFEKMWIDRDRIYFYHGSNQLEVIEITPRAAVSAKPITSPISPSNVVPTTDHSIWTSFRM